MFSCRHIQRIANCYHGSKTNERVRNPKLQIRIGSFYFSMPIIKKYIISKIRNMVNFERCKNSFQFFRWGQMNTSHKWNISVDEKSLKCACSTFFLFLPFLIWKFSNFRSNRERNKIEININSNYVCIAHNILIGFRMLTANE